MVEKGGIKENILINKTREVVRRLGIFKSLILSTLVSIIISVLLTILLLEVSDLYAEPKILFISVVIPLIVSPTITVFLFQTLNNLDSTLISLDNLLKKDDLTQVFNKKYFYKKAAELFNRKKLNSANKFAILMIDVDHFKNVNDGHGHLVGDNVLFDLAKIISENVRENDIVARYGGEEFVILLSDVDQERGVFIAERIREKIEQASFCYNNRLIKCTISVGISFFNDKILNIDELLTKADQALYEAKDNGRNCIMLK